MLVTHSLTDWLTDSLLFSKLDWCEDANSKLVDVVTVADEDHVDNNLLQISKLNFCSEHKVWSRFWSWSSGKICSWSLASFFFCWCFVEVMKLNLGRDFEARFEQVLWRGWCLVEILKLTYSRDSEDEIWSRFVFELVIWTQPSGPLCLWQCLFSVSAWSLLFILITTSTPHSRFCHLDNSYSFFVRQITISWTHLHLRTNRC